MTDSKVAVRRKLSRLRRRRMHVRKKLIGSAERPRLVVYRSNKHMYAQLVDDLGGGTITGCSTMSPELKDALKADLKKQDKAKLVGEHLAKLAKDRGIEKVSFDRNGRRYHGRVKALADGARSGGLKF